MEQNVYKNLINKQYAVEDLPSKIKQALIKAGKEEDKLNLSDLSPMDEIHAGGLEATARLAALAGLPSGARTLDIGCGLGGPARFLAKEYGCRVTGVDITENFCRNAKQLTERLDFNLEVNFINASALKMPFKDNSCDAVWSQHCFMNIKNKNALFSEFHRVLGKKGRLAIHEIMAGPLQPIHFPVPWADNPSISFLTTAAETQRKLVEAGFQITYWEDISQEALEWRQKLKNDMKRQGPPPLNQKLIFGSALKEIGLNMRNNLMEKRINIIQGVAVKMGS